MRHRTARGWNPVSTHTMHRYYAITEKNNQVEYVDDGQDAQDCVRTLFPHLGDAPCWTLNGKKEERVDE